VPFIAQWPLRHRGRKASFTLSTATCLAFALTASTSRSRALQTKARAMGRERALLDDAVACHLPRLDAIPFCSR
jgi:hypothetical protein